MQRTTTTDVHETAKQLKSAVVARLADTRNTPHHAGLMKCVVLCEKFINSSTASTPQAFQVLQDEVEKALLAAAAGAGAPHKNKPTSAPAHTRTRTTYATTAAEKKKEQAQQLQQQHQRHQHHHTAQTGAGATALPATTKATTAKLQRVKQVPTVLAYDVAAPELATALLEHKAHLTLNDYDLIVLSQVDEAQQQDAQRTAQKRQEQQQIAAIRAAQLAEVHAQRDAQRQAKLREVEQMDAAVEAACQAEIAEKQQLRAAQQRQWSSYRQQQQEAAAIKRRAALAAERELALERAELQEAEEAAAAAAAAQAAANRAKLELFNAEREAALAAKRAAAVARQEREREYVEECKRAMEAAEAKRLEDQEAWRTKQKATYEAAGGIGMERKLQQQAKYVVMREADVCGFWVVFHCCVTHQATMYTTPHTSTGRRRSVRHVSRPLMTRVRQQQRQQRGRPSRRQHKRCWRGCACR